MQELLPEFWAGGKGESSRGVANRGKGCRTSWCGCSVMLNTWASKFLEVVPELMAYQVGVLRASIELEGGAWAAYDVAYHRQAAATGHRRWSKVNPSLYSLCFTGKAKQSSRCEFCLGSSHKSEECALAVEEDLDLGKRMKAVESAVVAFSAKTGGEQQGNGGDLCRLYQQNRCTFVPCKFTHSCRRCGGPHPMSGCGRAAPQPIATPQLQQQPLPGPARRAGPRAQGYGAPY